MNRKQLLSAALLLVFAMTPAAFAAMSEHEGHKMDSQMGHSGMEMHGDMVMLGEKVQDGVKAMAHLKDVREAMGKMGMEQTHHFMVFLTDAETGEAITSGAVAVKVTNPSGAEGDAVKLMGMGKGFGADVTLGKPGMYHFEIGSKVKDGHKRQFMFMYTVK